MSSLDAAIKNPAKVYPKGPRDVIRDRRFDDAEKLKILEAWDPRSEAELVDVLALKAEIEARMGGA